MKKLSKRLLAMMLVAIMVVAAIPFGAFAEGECEHDWQYDSSRSGEIVPGKPGPNGPDKGTHPVTCSKCSAEDAAYHSFNEAGECTVCGYKAGCSHSWKFQVASAEKHFYLCELCHDTQEDFHTFGSDGKCTVCGFSHEHKFDGGTVPNSGNASGHKVACSVEGCTATTTASHEGETYEEIAAKEATCTSAGNKAGKRFACGYVEGNEEIPALGHVDANEDGICDRCGATGLPVAKKTYAIIVSIGSERVEGAAKEMTMKEIEDSMKDGNSVRAFLSGLGGKYKTVADQMANDDYLDYQMNGTNITIFLKTSAPEPDPDPAEQDILVIYDDGNTRTITKKNNVGTWYFSSSNLGLSNSWGTKQAILKIEDSNGYRYVKWGSKDADAYIRKTDHTVWVLGNNKTVTIYYLKSSTSNPTTTNAHAVRKYEFNTQLGTLPSLPAGYNAWYVDGVRLTENTVYDWETDYVYAYPGKGDGDGRVHLFIYNNNKQLMKNVDVTDNVQSNGLITKSGLLKTIEYQTGYKNPSLAGLFTESGWAYYLNNDKSTRYAQSEISVGVAGEREGTQNIYVVLTGVSGGSNADTSNPKTGDNAMIGTAAIVMALAVVGMGTVFFMKKREMI